MRPYFVCSSFLSENACGITPQCRGLFALAFVVVAILVAETLWRFRRLRKHATAKEETLHGLGKVYIFVHIFSWTGVMLLLAGDDIVAFFG